MNKYQEAKRWYDEQAILAILNDLDEQNQCQLRAREQFIIGLTYLSRTKRYQEHAAYKKSTFEDFLGARYGLNLSTFYRERAAFINYEDEVFRVGLGTVQKVINNVPKEKQQEVFGSIKSNTPLRKQNEVIEQNAKPKPEPKPAVPKQSESEVSLKKQVLSLQNELAAKEKQLKKARAAVVYWKDKYNELQSMLNPVWQAVEQQKRGAGLVFVGRKSD